MQNRRFAFAAAVWLLAAWSGTGCRDATLTGPAPTDPLAAAAPAKPSIRTYYISADKVPWDYAPSGHDMITGEAFGDAANVFVESGPDRIGRVYYKALYREYTDASFTTLRADVDAAYAERWAHLGTLGPAIQAQVGDTIVVVFRNDTELSISVHPHGVFYDKASEGAPYDDGTDAKDDDAVPPGGTYTYTWPVPERAGPGPKDGSSILWMYHSHTDEVMDTNTGLIGPMMITGRGRIRQDGRPLDVDRELVMLFTVYDENSSWYLDENIATFAGDPASVDRDDEDFVESNLMHAINGWVYGNQPLASVSMRAGEKVRWYMLGMGTEVDLHTPHWHGQTGIVMGMRTDIVELLPASMKVFDMVPDNPGIWLFHCHVNDHITAGMLTRFEVLP